MAGTAGILGGTIEQTRPFQLTASVEVDATGHAVTFDGGKTTRHFTVTNGATLRLIGVRLVNGRYEGTRGEAGGVGQAAWGGSICSWPGTVELVECQFISNEALGGQGGTSVQYSTPGGAAYGGAVFSRDGTIAATNSVFSGNRCMGGDGVPALDGLYTGPGGHSFGSAIYSTNGSITLASVCFTNNIAQGGGIGSGGRAIKGGGQSQQP